MKTLEEYSEELKKAGLEIVNESTIVLKHEQEDNFALPSRNLIECWHSDESAEDIKDQLENAPIPAGLQEFIEQVKNPQEIFALLTGEQQRNDVLSRDYYGMNLIPYVQNDDMSARVTKQLAKLWGASEEHIFNSIVIKQEWQIMNLLDLVKDQIDFPITEQELNIDMYVITNKSKVNGAAVLLDTEYLEQVRLEIGDYYILPSSRHEIIAVPVARLLDGATIEDLRKMVHEVNSTEVSERDFLSNDVFMFTERGLCIAE